MPGANCAIFGCSTSRKSKGISIHKIPAGEDDYNKTWREELINIITRDRAIDQSLKNQIERKQLYICELHFHESCLLRHEKRTTLIPKSLPTLNLPVKSFTKAPKQDRSKASIEKRATAAAVSVKSITQDPVCYKSFPDFLQRITKLKLKGWVINNKDNFVSITKHDGLHVPAKFEINVNKDLKLKILCYNWLIPEQNELIKKHESSMKNTTLSTLLYEIENMKICEGVSYKTDKIISHSIPKVNAPCQHPDPISYTTFNRPSECLLLSGQNQCFTCAQKYQQHLQYLKRKESKRKEPAKPNAPVSLTSPDRLKASLQSYRIENKELKNQISKLQNELKKSSVKTSDSLNKDLVSIMSSADPSKVSPFMKFFWEEQQKYIQASSTGVRYHPAIIRYCLSLLSKSSSMYDDIRYNEKTGTGFLILPSQRRLRDYKNYIRPERGFNKHIIEELKQKTSVTLKNMSSYCLTR